MVFGGIQLLITNRMYHEKQEEPFSQSVFAESRLGA